MSRLIFLVLFIATLVGCGRQSNPAIVNIQSVTPSGDVGLVSGDKVKFVVVARVDGLTKPSVLALVVQSNIATIGMTNPVSVENGKVVTIELEATVPDGPSLSVFTPLYEIGVDNTDVMDTRVFKIIGKRS